MAQLKSSLSPIKNLPVANLYNTPYENPKVQLQLSQPPPPPYRLPSIINPQTPPKSSGGRRRSHASSIKKEEKPVNTGNKQGRNTIWANAKGLFIVKKGVKQYLERPKSKKVKGKK